MRSVCITYHRKTKRQQQEITGKVFLETHVRKENQQTLLLFNVMRWITIRQWLMAVDYFMFHATGSIDPVPADELMYE